MAGLFRLNKKAVSEIVGYSILIVISLSIGGLVYFYLNDHISRGESECSDGISIAIQSASCSNGQITLNLLNTGRFTIKGIYVKLGLEDKEVQTTIFPNPQYEDAEPGVSIDPGTSYPLTSSAQGKSGRLVLSVHPAMPSTDGTRWTICDKAVTSTKVTC